MTDPLECPNCHYKFWPEIDRMLDARARICECRFAELFDEIMTCYMCRTKIRIFEENDFGDWTREIIEYKDPNQVEILLEANQ